MDWCLYLGVFKSSSCLSLLPLGILCRCLFKVTCHVHQVGEKLTRREVFKHFDSGSAGGRCARHFGNVKGGCLTWSGVAREVFLEEGPLELNLKD